MEILERYLGRKVDVVLAAWKADPMHKPLLVKGARQIGKTEAIRHFARGAYENFHEINFVLREEFKQIVDEGCSVQSILRRISLIEPGWRFVPGQTLILFDEIQELPAIAASLKSFAQDGRFDVIASGSMLGIQYKQISSLSMGYKTDVDMKAMDFEEFLRAKGYGDETFESIYAKMRTAKPFDALELRVFGGLFRDFCVLGGMPEVVGRYVTTGTFEGTLALQRMLVDGMFLEYYFDNAILEYVDVFRDAFESCYRVYAFSLKSVYNFFSFIIHITTRLSSLK